MSVENIVDYVMNSPQNTNRMVLKGLIESEVEKSGAGLEVITLETVFDAVNKDNPETFMTVNEADAKTLETAIGKKKPVIINLQHGTVSLSAVAYYTFDSSISEAEGKEGLIVRTADHAFLFLNVAGMYMGIGYYVPATRPT